MSRFISILGANRLAYAAVVGTGNAGIGAYKFQQELVDIMLDADSIVVTQGYFQSEQPLRNRFLTPSVNLPNGAKLPEFEGLIGKAEYSTDGINWLDSKEALAKQDVVGARAHGSGYISAAAFAGHHFIDGDYVFHTSPFFRVEYPLYAKTTSLQCLVNHEPALISTALGLAYKESNLHAAEWYEKKGEYLLERIRQGSMRMKSYTPRPLPEEMRG